MGSLSQISISKINLQPRSETITSGGSLNQNSLWKRASVFFKYKGYLRKGMSPWALEKRQFSKMVVFLCEGEKSTPKYGQWCEEWAENGEDQQTVVLCKSMVTSAVKDMICSQSSPHVTLLTEVPLSVLVGLHPVGLKRLQWLPEKMLGQHVVSPLFGPGCELCIRRKFSHF